MADTIRCDLAIIGSGIAGMAAAVFAARQGMNVAQAGNTGSLAYTTGYFDLLGAIPATEENGKARRVSQPLESLSELLQAFPDHPYRFLQEDDMRAAFDALIDFFKQSGLNYECCGTGNFAMPSPAGTLKQTWCVPSTMKPAADMLAADDECVFVDFAGLKGFSARQLASNLSAKRANLRAETVTLPGRGGEVFPENVARMLETEVGREDFAKALAPAVGKAEWMGVPACLGIYKPDEILKDMETRLGVKLFEIPTMPPGVPGIRIKEAFEEACAGMGVHLFRQQKMIFEGREGDKFKLRVVGTSVERKVLADKVLLASGRFLGGGLAGHRTGIEETVLGLPVKQPESRSEWHQIDYFDQRGHQVHHCGVRYDETFRPLTENNTPMHENIHAAGSILAGSDWMRMKCGAGVAVGTAYAAIKAMQK